MTADLRSQTGVPASEASHPLHAGADAYRRIAFLRANGIGDFVFALPALAALRYSFPRAELIYLGNEAHVELLEGRGLVDRSHIIPSFPGVTAGVDAPFDQDRIGDFLHAVMTDAPDVVIQAHGGGRFSNTLATSFGAPLVVGMRAKDAPPIDRYVPYRVYHNEYDRYLEVVALLGAHPDPQVGHEPVLPVLAADLAQSEQVVSPSDEPFVVLNTGATDERRRWHEDGFIEVARHVIRAGHRVVLTGNRTDVERTARVARELGSDAVDIAGRTSLGGLIGTLARAEAVVSNDTGALHLARAVGTPTVGLFWCGNLINSGPTRRTDHRALISWRTYCEECGVSCIEGVCGHEASFITDIPTEHVVLETLDLLETVKPIRQELMFT